MPINIYRNDSCSEDRKIAWLCDESWSLVEQMHALEEWLKTEGVTLPKGEYVADVGISVRENFEGGVGGGVAFPPEAMAIMAEKGIYLYLSEYPSGGNEQTAEHDSSGNSCRVTL